LRKGVTRFPQIMVTSAVTCRARRSAVRWCDGPARSMRLFRCPGSTSVRHPVVVAIPCKCSMQRSVERECRRHRVCSTPSRLSVSQNFNSLRSINATSDFISFLLVAGQTCRSFWDTHRQAGSTLDWSRTWLFSKARFCGPSQIYAQQRPGCFRSRATFPVLLRPVFRSSCGKVS
jgi:hypothetical protein